MAQYLESFNFPDDKLIDKRKKTAGFFTGDVGTVNSSSFTTSSLSAGNKEYYYNLKVSDVDQLSVAYGHLDGSGSADAVGQTKAIYWQFANLLLDMPDGTCCAGLQPRRPDGICPQGPRNADGEHHLFTHFCLCKHFRYFRVQQLGL